MNDHSIIREFTLLQSVINAIPAPIFFKDADGVYLGCNQAFEEYVGKTREELVGKGVFELWDQPLAQKYFEADDALTKAGGKQSYEAQVKYADGTLHDVLFHKAVFHSKSEDIRGLVGVILDITERKRAETELEKLATTDSLTGLYNRHYLYAALDACCKKAKRRGSELAVLFLDLDGFKAVNDSYGHAVGDQLLIAIAQRLRECVRESDNVARFGGDEFIVVIEDIDNRAQCERVAEQILHRFRQPFFIENKPLMIGTSIGIATYPDNGLDSQSLLKNSDLALYQAKTDGKGKYFCSEV
ncbi:MAG: diguanylate cyclase [Halopseudomonas sp.]